MRAHKKLFVFATVLLAAGVIICGISFAILGFDIRALNTLNLVTNEYEIDDDFEHISIRGDIESVVFAVSEEGKCRVVCYEDERDLHSVRVEEDTLTIDKQSAGGSFIGIITESPKITVYLPGGAYGALLADADTGNITVPRGFTFASIQIKLDTGSIELSASAEGDIVLNTDTGGIDLRELSAGDIALSSDTGHIIVENVTVGGKLKAKTATGRQDITNATCVDLYSTGDTGSLYLTSVIASGEYHIKRDTGNVRFDGCDAEAIYVETDTGDVAGTLLTDKVFLTETDTGRVDVPKTIAGGSCAITTDTGNISVSVP